MTQQVLAVLLLTAGAGAIRAADDTGSDVVPLVPVAQKRMFDTRYYSGPTGNPLTLSPDGKIAVGTGGSNQLLVYELGKTPGNRPARTLQTDNPNFYRPVLAFSADGQTLVGMSNNHPDYNLRFWDVASGKELRQIDNDQQFQSLALSPDGKLLALGTNQRVEIWDTATADEVRTLPGLQNAVFQALAFSGDGRMLACASNEAIQVWEVASGQERALLRLRAPQPAGVNFAFRGGVSPSLASLAFSADGAILAGAGQEATVRLWNLRTGRELPPLMGHQGLVTGLVFTADGRRLLSLDTGGLKLEWDARRLAALGTSKVRAPTDSDLADLWDSLADADAFQAYRAARLLAADPKRAIAFLQERLQPVPHGNTDQINQLIADLQNPSGSVRRKAMTALRQHGEPALGALMNAVPRNQGVNQNVVMMISKLENSYNTPERQQALKAVQALEQIGNAEARGLLEKLAKGAPGTRLTVAAQASLSRLQDRSAAAQGVREPSALWEDLATSDGRKAFAAIVQFGLAGGKGVPFLREHVKPIAQPLPRHLEDLVAALDDASFATRQKAMNALDQLGEMALPVLRKALSEPLSLEARNRLEQLVSKHERQSLSGSQLQQLRALEALEQIGSPDARQLLQDIAQGAPAARLTREATASLNRLEKRAAR